MIKPNINKKYKEVYLYDLSLREIKILNFFFLGTII